MFATPVTVSSLGLSALNKAKKPGGGGGDGYVAGIDRAGAALRLT